MLDLRIIDNSTGEIVYSASQLGEATRNAKISPALYKGFMRGYEKTSGGILASATRDAIRKHVTALKDYDWEE